MHSKRDTSFEVGCPIRKSQDLGSVTSSPGLIAGSYVLHRLSTPRHSPCALCGLITPTRPRDLRQISRIFGQSTPSWEARFFHLTRPQAVAAAPHSEHYLFRLLRSYFKSCSPPAHERPVVPAGWFFNHPPGHRKRAGGFKPVHIRLSMMLALDGINPLRAWISVQRLPVSAFVDCTDARGSVGMRVWVSSAVKSGGGIF